MEKIILITIIFLNQTTLPPNYLFYVSDISAIYLTKPP